MGLRRLTESQQRAAEAMARDKLDGGQARSSVVNDVAAWLIAARGFKQRPALERARKIVVAVDRSTNDLEQLLGMLNRCGVPYNRGTSIGQDDGPIIVTTVDGEAREQVVVEGVLTGDLGASVAFCFALDGRLTGLDVSATVAPACENVATLGKIDYSKDEPPPGYRCTECGVTGSRLWRLGNRSELFCAHCACEPAGGMPEDLDELPAILFVEDRDGQPMSFFPAVPTPDGTSFWKGLEGGVDSTPADAVAWWKRLPTRSPDSIDTEGPEGTA